MEGGGEEGEVEGVCVEREEGGIGERGGLCVEVWGETIEVEKRDRECGREGV